MKGKQGDRKLIKGLNEVQDNKVVFFLDKLKVLRIQQILRLVEVDLLEVGSSVILYLCKPKRRKKIGRNFSGSKEVGLNKARRRKGTKIFLEKKKELEIFQGHNV